MVGSKGSGNASTLAPWPLIQLFAKPIRGSLLEWATEEATQIDLELLRAWLREAVAFDARSSLDDVETLWSKFSLEKDEEEPKVVDVEVSVKPEPQLERRQLWRTATAIVAKSASRVDSQLSKQLLEVETLLRHLGEQIDCEALLLIPNATVPHEYCVPRLCTLMPQVTVGSAVNTHAARLLDERHPDWSIAANSPAGACIASGESVLVDDMLHPAPHGPAFDSTGLNLDSVSQLCLPIKIEGRKPEESSIVIGVIKCLNKQQKQWFWGMQTGVPFQRDDISVGETYAASLLQMAEDHANLKKVATILKHFSLKKASKATSLQTPAVDTMSSN